MRCSCRNTDPVVCFTEHLHNFIADVQAEQTATFHKEPHFVLCVDVLFQKLSAQGDAIWMIRKHPDGINARVMPSSLRSCDFAFVVLQDLLR